ncbi:MAG TPA: PQQ-binding-like beta-propeller repeat protein [Gemmatimonadaceae bacterium]|nr:PQQ-binding-like beta-propeller repeat protein [Gemmatimonadaceae bacterium]
MPVEVREYLLTPSRAPSAGETIDVEPRLVWRATAGRGVASLPAVSSRVTLVTSTDRWVYAIDTRSGATFWRRRGDGAYSTGAVAAAGRVFVASEGTGGRITALRLTDGGRIWQVAVGDVSAPLALRDSVLYGVNDDGEAFALGVARGNVLWKRNAGPARGGALVTARRVVLATLRDSLIVLERESGAIVGAFRLPASTAAPLAIVDDSTAVMSSPAGWIVALDIGTGAVRWSVRADEPVRGSPVVHRDTVFALGGSCTLIRVPHHAPDVPRRDMHANCVTVAAPLVLRDGVLVATVSGDVTFISRATGAAVWTRRTGGTIRHPPVVLDRQVVLATLGGEIFSFR